MLRPSINENTIFNFFGWGSGFHFFVVFSVMGVGELKVCETCGWVGQVNQVFFHFGIGLVVSALRFIGTVTSCKQGVNLRLHSVVISTTHCCKVMLLFCMI